MSDLMRHAHQMALPDPYDERDDPNWMLLMRELIQHIETVEAAYELQGNYKALYEALLEKVVSEGIPVDLTPPWEERQE